VVLDKIRTSLAIRLLPSKATGTNPFSVASTSTPNVAVYSDMSIRKATREGYKISIYVYRAVRTIVQAASAIPWVILDGNGEIIKDHPLAKVLRRPNPVFSGQDMMEILIAHELLGGNALWMPIIVNGKVKEFWPVMPDLVKPIPSGNADEWLKGWQVTSHSERKVLPPEQFIHFMQMDPGNLYWGTSPLMAAARTVDTDNEAQDTQKISMQNRGMTDGVFSHETVLTPEQFEEAKRVIREQYLAKNKRREPWVLGAGAKWTQMSMTPIEMDYILSRLANLRGIATAFGLDPWVLGDRSASTYNNVIEVRKAVYIDVALPMLDDIKNTLNNRIAPMYGNIEISYDTSKVAALREDFGAKVEQADKLWSMGIPFERINARLEMGFDEFEGWETGYLPFNLMPVGSQPVESVEPEPDEDSDSTVYGQKAFDLNEEQKTMHWKRVDRRRVAWWSVVARKMKPLYDSEAKAIIKALSGVAATENELTQAASQAISDGRSEWEKTMTAVLLALIEDFGGVIAEDLGGKSMSGGEHKWEFDPTTEAVRRWIIAKATDDIVTILATNLDDVKSVILAGVDEKLSTTTISRNIRQFYSDRSPFKAMRVARTEVNHAAGFGQREAASQSGVAKTHSWISSRDDRVRDEHVLMDTDANHDVPFDTPYSDGSMYPGEQDIMCRCAESYGTK